MNQLDKLKEQLKKHPRFYTWLIDNCGPILHTKKEKQLIEEVLNSGDLVLNLGAGTKRYGHAKNVDIEQYDGVDIVCDIEKLPYKMAEVDGVICEMVLEHTTNPQKIVEEIYRVVKPGGLVYVTVPFLVGFHSSPTDYYRWTIDGFQQLMSHFSEIEMGVRGGPASSFCWVTQCLLALFLSGNWSFLFLFWWMVFGILLWPVKYLDLYLARLSKAHEISSGFYFLGRG